MRIVDGSVSGRWAIIKSGVVHCDVFTGANWETGLLSWVQPPGRVADGVDGGAAAVGGRAGGRGAAALSRLPVICTMHTYMTSAGHCTRT